MGYLQYDKSVPAKRGKLAQPTLYLKQEVSECGRIWTKSISSDSDSYKSKVNEMPWPVDQGDPPMIPAHSITLQRKDRNSGSDAFRKTLMRLGMIAL